MREQALMGDSRAGDLAAFSALFDTYHGPITGYLYRLTGNRDVADDLAQDTFLKAYRALTHAAPDVNPRAWLYRIATNTAHSYHRRRRLVRWLPLPRGDADGSAEPAEDATLADRLGERELVEAALRQIGPAHSAVLLLRHHQRLSIEETAEALDINANAAKVRLYRARKAFVAAYTALSRDGEDA